MTVCDAACRPLAKYFLSMHELYSSFPVEFDRLCKQNPVQPSILFNANTKTTTFSAFFTRRSDANVWDFSIFVTNSTKFAKDRHEHADAHGLEHMFRNMADGALQMLSTIFHIDRAATCTKDEVTQYEYMVCYRKMLRCKAHRVWEEKITCSWDCHTFLLVAIHLGPFVWCVRLCEKKLKDNSLEQ